MSGPGEGVLWVASEQTLDGPYVVSFCHGAHAWVRTPSECLAYASAVVAAAHRADHDAAVVRQMISVGVTPDEAGHLVLELRADRPPLAGLAPLDLQLGGPVTASSTPSSSSSCTARSSGSGRWVTPWTTPASCWAWWPRPTWTTPTAPCC